MDNKPNTAEPTGNPYQSPLATSQRRTGRQSYGWRRWALSVVNFTFGGFFGFGFLLTAVAAARSGTADDLYIAIVAAVIAASFIQAGILAHPGQK